MSYDPHDTNKYPSDHMRKFPVSPRPPTHKESSPANNQDFFAGERGYTSAGHTGQMPIPSQDLFAAPNLTAESQVAILDDNEQELQELDSEPDFGRSKTERRKNFLEWVVVIVGAVLIAFLIRGFLVQAFFIPTGSMNETLIEGDRVLVNKMSFRIGDIDRQDIVVFNNPGVTNPTSTTNEIPGSVTAGDQEIDHLIKRVIGLPGEKLEFKGNQVFIDGELLNEPYLEPSLSDQDFAIGTNSSTIVIPEGHYYMMGDNRNNSADSRVIGAIEEKEIIGKAFFRFWPVDRIGGLS